MGAYELTEEGAAEYPCSYVDRGYSGLRRSCDISSKLDVAYDGYPLVAGIDGALAGAEGNDMEDVVERMFCCCLSASKLALLPPMELGNS